MNTTSSDSQVAVGGLHSYSGKNINNNNNEYPVDASYEKNDEKMGRRLSHSHMNNTNANEAFDATLSSNYDPAAAAAALPSAIIVHHQQPSSSAPPPPGATATTRQRNKGVVCKSFLDGGVCSRTHDCPYLHVTDGESRPVPDTQCSFFRHSVCLREGCRFFHGPAERLAALRRNGTAATYRLQDEMEIRTPPPPPPLGGVEGGAPAFLSLTGAKGTQQQQQQQPQQSAALLVQVPQQQQQQQQQVTPIVGSAQASAQQQQQQHYQPASNMRGPAVMWNNLIAPSSGGTLAQNFVFTAPIEPQQPFPVALSGAATLGQTHHHHQPLMATAFHFGGGGSFTASFPTTTTSMMPSGAATGGAGDGSTPSLYYVHYPMTAPLPQQQTQTFVFPTAAGSAGGHPLHLVAPGSAGTHGPPFVATIPMQQSGVVPSQHDRYALGIHAPPVPQYYYHPLSSPPFATTTGGLPQQVYPAAPQFQFMHAHQPSSSSSSGGGSPQGAFGFGNVLLPPHATTQQQQQQWR